MTNLRVMLLFSLAGLAALPGMAQTIGGGNCSAAMLNGQYSLTLGGRDFSTTGTNVQTYEGGGIANFDGVSKVTFTGTVNTNLAQAKTFTYSGTYTVSSNCTGTLTLTQGSSATFTLAVWGSGQQYNIIGSDGTYTYFGSGSGNQPAACGTSSLSGGYTYDATGPTLSGTAITSVADESGVFQFDGQGNVTASYTISSSQASAVQLTSSGTYTVASNCTASATLKDSNGATNTLNFVLEGVYGQNAQVLEANPQFIRSGSAHTTFVYHGIGTLGSPMQSIPNVASYAFNGTPPGSVFAIFGQNLATSASQAANVPLPTKLLSTTVTVNNEAIPLFYVSQTQIDAQMPWDIPGNTLAAVIVKNTGANGSTSNAVGLYVPATATPGLSFYSNNRAVVVNSDNKTVNSASAPASVGDEVTLYFTGGGPVNAAGKLTSGAGAPSGLSPVTDMNASITVGGKAAVVDYIGLTPGGIGLYQANFVVPQLAKGSYPVVLTIDGTASNTLAGQPYPNPVMNVGN